MLFQILLFSALAILVGLSFTFAGYRFMRVLLPIWGFFAGLWLGASTFGNIFGETFLATATGLFVGFFFGLVLAAMAYFLYSFAIILLGATVGFAIGQGFMLLIGFNEGLLAWLVGAALAVVFAFVFAVFKFPRLLLVVLTAFGGAMAVIYGVLLLFGGAEVGEGLEAARSVVNNSFLWSVAWLVLAFLGIGTQYSMEKSVDWMEVYTVEELPASTKATKTAEPKAEDKTETKKEEK